MVCMSGPQNSFRKCTQFCDDPSLNTKHSFIVKQYSKTITKRKQTKALNTYNVKAIEG